MLLLPDYSVTFHESVREADVYIVATAGGQETSSNTALMECVAFPLCCQAVEHGSGCTTDPSSFSDRLCIMAHTLRIASARRITAVL